MKKDRVLVPKDSLTRCGWCGSYYSPDWIQIIPSGPKYCSHECLAASRIRVLENDLIQSKASLWFFASLFVIFTLLLVSFPQALEVWLTGILASLLCFCMGFGLAKSNREARKYLYRKDMYCESYPILIECGFCSHLNPPDALDCQHCDASLRDSQSVEGQIPDWFGSEELKTQKKCPHCDAVYVYDFTEDKKTLLCQNCGKQFPISDET